MNPVLSAALVLALATARNALLAPFVPACRYRAHCRTDREQEASPVISSATRHSAPGSVPPAPREQRRP